MSTKIVFFPDLGLESVKIVTLLQKEGANLKIDMPLMALESDKIQLDIPVTENGVLSKWLCKPGDILKIGDAVCEILLTNIVENIKQDFEVYASPRVRRLAREHSIDLFAIKGSGFRSRILESDLFPTKEDQNEIFSYSLTSIQQASAKHIAHSLSTIAQVSHGLSVDITLLENWRLEAESRKFKISVLPMVLKAVYLSLNKFPVFGSRLIENDTKLLSSSLKGINLAIDTERGLLVPNIDIDKLSLMDLLDNIKKVSHDARSFNYQNLDLRPAEITVSSLGAVGGEWFTPIVNFPQIAIIGVMKAKWQPCWLAGSWVPRYMLPLVLSYDHRAVDGVLAQKFLNEIGINLEKMHENTWLSI